MRLNLNISVSRKHPQRSTFTWFINAALTTLAHVACMNDMSPLQTAKIPATAMPVSVADRIDWLRLARSHRVGPATFIRLLREHGSACAALDALPQIAANAGSKSYQITSLDRITQELAAGAMAGAKLLCLGEDEYPPELSLIDDPPPVLWALGNPALAKRKSIALVGARNSSSLGRRMAQKLAEELSELGFVVASGLARGIDAAAHKAALQGGTIAVLAGGVDVVYPQENAELTAQIAAEGLILSEMPMGMTPQARHFPRRNRIISGLSQAVVVVEGAARSGSLITARNALDQGRDVMAVPGHPFDARASGCNMLIRDGATLVRCAKDVADALNIPTPERVVPSAKPQPAAPQIHGDGARTLINLLGPTPVSEDAVIRQMELPTPVVLELLMGLDMQGLIERHPGGLISRAGP